MNTITLGVIIILFFIWRFFRTYQLYLTSLNTKKKGLEPIKFDPGDWRNFIQQVILGRRTVKPISFFIRAFVLTVIALILLPLKDYEPFLFRLIIVMIVLYIPWCIMYGVLLNSKLK